jgi:hypothetical protein
MLNDHHSFFYTTGQRREIEKWLQENLDPSTLGDFLSILYPRSPETINGRSGAAPAMMRSQYRRLKLLE